MGKSRPAALGFIFVTLLIDVIGFGIIIPVVPELITTLIHGDLSAASKYGGWLMGAYAVMQFLFAPVLGNLSDRYGRRPILLFSLFGFGADYLFTAFAPTITWLFVGRIFAGITGASMTTAMAYIADITPPEKKSAELWPCWRSIWIGIYHRPGYRRFIGNIWRPYAFLCSRGAHICELDIWIFYFTGVFEKRKPPAIRVETRQSCRFTDADKKIPGTGRPDRVIRTHLSLRACCTEHMDLL